MTNETTQQIDWNFFELVIAYNCTFSDVYLATVVDQLKLKYVNNSDIKAYLGILFDYYKKHSTLPNATEIRLYLSDEDLKKSYKNVVTKFTELDKEYNQDELISNTEKFIRERAVYHAVKETVDEVSSSSKLDTGEIFTRFENACNISLVDNLGFDYFEQIDQHIVDISTTDRYISTGYKWFDKVLGGGLLEQGRAIYLWQGATNSGKSIVLGNLAANILTQDRTVVVITLEMPETIYAKRISSRLTNIPIGTLKAETILLQQSLKDFYRLHPRSKLILKEFPPNSVSVNHIKAYLKNLIQKKHIHIDAIVIDYLTLLQANMVVGSLYSDNKAVTEQLRALSYPVYFGCPILSACQSNRDAYDKANPGLESTGESMGIAHTADFFASIWSSEADKELGIINMGLQKSRFGINYGKQAFKIDYDTLTISEMDDIFNETSEVQEADNMLERLSN